MLSRAADDKATHGPTAVITSGLSVVDSFVQSSVIKARIPAFLTDAAICATLYACVSNCHRYLWPGT
jgi:hypothetical protein